MEHQDIVENVPTVFSQTSYPIWNTIIEQQLDQTYYNTLMKAIESQDSMYHDSLGLLYQEESLIINPFMLHQNVIKDDVFLVQPNQVIMSTNKEDKDDDTLSLSSHSSLSCSSQPQYSPPTQYMKETDVDWCKLLDIFGTDMVYDLPTTTTLHEQPQQENLELIKKRPSSDESSISRQKRRKKSKTLTENNKKLKKNLADQELNELVEPMKDDDEKTLYQYLTEQSIDWCRYCGTTEGVNWRPGPWGKRTLCNKHGCDYKGYGLASRLPRLDLSLFVHEKLDDRIRPVIQHFCTVCQSPELDEENTLIMCEGGCSRAYHQHCHTPAIKVNPVNESMRWYCSASCKENRKRNKVVVELPRKHIPLMHLLPKSMIRKP